MAKMNWDKERQRLTTLYAGMEDGELRKIANDFGGLNEVAKDALRAEISKRSLSISLLASAVAPAEAEAPLPEKPPPEASLPQLPSPKFAAPVLLRKFLELPNAMIAQSVLDSAGISSFLADDNIIRMDWFVSNAIGGVKLFVDSNDAAAASELLKQLSSEKPGLADPESLPQAVCPRCGSADTSFEGLKNPLALAGILLRSNFPATRKGWKCNACNYKWKDEDADNSPDLDSSR